MKKQVKRAPARKSKKSKPAAAKRALTDRQRAALGLWKGGKSFQEIADALDVTRPYASHLVYTARGGVMDGQRRVTALPARPPVRKVLAPAEILQRDQEAERKRLARLERERKARKDRIKRGICGELGCGKKRRPDATTCEECGAASAERSARARQRLFDAGMCTLSCGNKASVVDGVQLPTCAECRERNAERTAEYRAVG